MTETKSPPSGDPQLWLLTRYLERAFRSLGDMELELTDEMIRRNRDAGEKAYATVMKGYPPPPPPCTPPTPCTRSLDDFGRFIDLMERLTLDMYAGFREKLHDAENLDIKKITFRMREYPMTPIGTTPNGGGGGGGGMHSTMTDAADRAGRTT